MMIRQKLKLKQASAVLQVQPKELQNLVQFGVIKPQRRAGAHFFDRKTLLAAKVALYLKESLGTSTSVLSRLMEAFSASEEKFRAQNPNYVVFSCRLTAEEEPIKLGVPFRALEEQVEQRINHVDLYKDLPRGRKRRGWKREFLESLSEAASDIGEISEDEILRTVRSYRKEKRPREITVALEG
jgi:DNA-binding transcriptional MerR regulator